jgi:hypothetical protein
MTPLGRAAAGLGGAASRPRAIVENLQITQWDPLFGVFRDLSSNPEGPDLPA